MIWLPLLSAALHDGALEFEDQRRAPKKKAFFW